MKTKIVQFKENIGNEIEGYFYLSDFKVSSGTNGRYANASIQDSSGKHVARVWGENINDREGTLIGHVVRMIGKVTSWDGKPSLVVAQMSLAEEGMYSQEDIVTMLSPENERYLKKSIYNAIDSIKNENIRKYTSEIFNGEYELFRRLPAGIKQHHNINGGLLIHTFEVVYFADNEVKLADMMLPIKGYGVAPDRDLVIAGAVLHDIGKIIEYEGFPGAKITKTGELLGHLNLGVKVLDDYNAGLGLLTEEQLIELKHIVISSHGEASPVIPKSLEALIVSQADNMSAQTDGYGVSYSEDLKQNAGDTGDFFYSRTKNQRFLRKG